MKVIAYARISTDQQDLDKQKHLLFEYAQQQQLLIKAFIEAASSSQKDLQQRKIDQLMTVLDPGDILLVAELSRLGRNMLETLNIINTLSEKEVTIIFVRQPELSTDSGHGKLLMAIYSYFAEAEREYISMRTKQGLAAAKAKGVKLGRPKGSKNEKGRVLDPYKDEIRGLLNRGVTISNIAKIINGELETPITYHSFRYFIHHDHDLKKALQK